MTWHYTITSEMRDLGLKGNELLIYAVIAGYSANGQGCYYGGIGYLSELCDIDPRTVIRLLKKLQERGLIDKEEVRARGVHRVSFWVNRGFENVTSNEVLEVTKDTNRSDIFSPTPIKRENININIPPVVDKSTTPPKGVSQPKFTQVEELFLAAGADEDNLRDWKKARKGAPLTEAVFKGMEREARKAGITLAEAVRICAENSWRGFRAEYLERKGSKAGQTGTFMGDIQRTYDQLAAGWAARAAQMEGGQR